MRLRLELDRERFSPGETIAGRVHVAAGGNTRSLEVLANFVEESPGYRSIVRSATSGVLHTGELQTGQLIEFAVELPPDALPNTFSVHAELYWELDARSDEPGRDTHTRTPIDVQTIR